MPNQPKVEKRTTCKICTSPLSGRLRAFCTPQCRNKYYASLPETKAYRAEHQRNRYRVNAANPSPDKLPCAICGRHYRRPVFHAYITHGINEREYKTAAGLDVKRGVLTAEARQRMADHVRANGTIHNLEAGAPHRWSATNPPPAYERSPETMERLRLHGLNLPHHNKRKNKKP